jgi:hypothetical protein
VKLRLLFLLVLAGLPAIVAVSVLVMPVLVQGRQLPVTLRAVQLAKTLRAWVSWHLAERSVRRWLAGCTGAEAWSRQYWLPALTMGSISLPRNEVTQKKAMARVASNHKRHLHRCPNLPVAQRSASRELS